MNPAGSFPARRALAARLVREEFRRRLERLDHARAVVHHDHAAGARHRARGQQRVEVHRHIDLFRREHLRRHSTGDHRLEAVPATHPLRVAIDQLAERDPHRRLVEPGPIHVSTDGEQPGAALFRRSQRGEAIRALAQNERNTGQRLDVVHDRWTLEQTRDGRERRLELGKAFSSLDRREQRGLLAADVGAGPAMDHDVQIEAASLNVLAKPAALVRFGHRTGEPFGRPEVLATNIDVGFVASSRGSSDDHAFEQGVRIALENVSILEGSWFPFVGIDDEVFGFRAAFRDERPFSAGRKPRAAQTAEVGL